MKKYIFAAVVIAAAILSFLTLSKESPIKNSPEHTRTNSATGSYGNVAF